MKMQKNIYAIMTAAMAASAVLVSSCNKDENATAPVFRLERDTITVAETLNGTIVAEAFLQSVDLRKSATPTGDYSSVTGYPKNDGTVGDGDFGSLPILRDGADQTKYTIVLSGSTIGAGYFKFVATDKNAKTTEKTFVVKALSTDANDEGNDEEERTPSSDSFVSINNDSVAGLLTIWVASRFYPNVWTHMVPIPSLQRATTTTSRETAKHLLMACCA
jgi:hypothetical protein